MNFQITLYGMCTRSLISVPTEPKKTNNYNILCGLEAMHVKLIYLSSFQVIMKVIILKEGWLCLHISVMNKIIVTFLPFTKCAL